MSKSVSQDIWKISRISHCLIHGAIISTILLIFSGKFYQKCILLRNTQTLKTLSLRMYRSLSGRSREIGKSIHTSMIPELYVFRQIMREIFLLKNLWLNFVYFLLPCYTPIMIANIFYGLLLFGLGVATLKYRKAIYEWTGGWWWAEHYLGRGGTVTALCLIALGMMGFGVATLFGKVNLSNTPSSTPPNLLSNPSP